MPLFPCLLKEQDVTEHIIRQVNCFSGTENHQNAKNRKRVHMIFRSAITAGPSALKHAFSHV
jgi:hypothetical protein